MRLLKRLLRGSNDPGCPVCWQIKGHAPWCTYLSRGRS